MTDERIEAELAAYVDDALPADRRAAVERYLAGNERYRRMVEEMRQARSWLAGLPAVTPPGGPDAWMAADPTVARLEREALFDDDDEPAPVGWELWRDRLTSPHALGLAAALAVAATLGLAAWVLLPNGEAGVATNPPPPPPVEVDDPVERVPVVPVPDDPPPSRDPPPPPAVDVGPAVADAGGDAGGEAADDATRPEPESPVPLPDVPERFVIVSAAVADPAGEAQAVAGVLRREDAAATAKRDAFAELPAHVLELAAIDPRLDGGGAGGVRAFVVVAPDGLPPPRVSAVLSRLGGGSRPLAAQDSAGPAPRRSGMRSARVADLESDFADDPAEDPADDPPPAAGQDEEPPPETDEAAARRVFPNDRLRLSLRRTHPLPPNLPAGLAGALGDELAAIDLAVDADGFLDLAPLALPRLDALGMTPAEVAAEVDRRLAREYLVGVDVTAATSRRSEVPGGRRAAALARLKLDRGPFSAGDAILIEFPSGLRLESLVGRAGRVTLGPVGEVEAGGRTPGVVQREVEARLAASPELAGLTLDAEGEAGVPAVSNLTVRREAGGDAALAQADAEPVAVVVVLLDAADLPATRPGDEWDLGDLE